MSVCMHECQGCQHILKEKPERDLNGNRQCDFFHKTTIQKEKNRNITRFIPILMPTISLLIKRCIFYFWWFNRIPLKYSKAVPNEWKKILYIAHSDISSTYIAHYIKLKATIQRQNMQNSCKSRLEHHFAILPNGHSGYSLPN